MPSDLSSPPNQQPDDLVVIAKIVRPRGLRGELIAEILTDFPERFADRKRLVLIGQKSGPRPIELERHWPHQGRIVLKFAGIDSIEAAEPLRNLEVAIPKSERAPLDDGAIYIADLIDATLIDARSNTEVGKIAEVDRQSSATPLLVIDTPNHGQVLVPFVKAFHPNFDAPTKRLTMQLPEGLLELNAPGAMKIEGPIGGHEDSDMEDLAD